MRWKEPPRIDQTDPFEGLPWPRPAEDDYDGLVHSGDAVAHTRCPVCLGELLPRMLVDGPRYCCQFLRNFLHGLYDTREFQDLPEPPWYALRALGKG